MKNWKKITALFLACLMVLSLCACGAGKASGSQSSSYHEAPAAAESAMMSYNAYGDSFAMEDALAGDYDTGLGAAAPVPKPEAQKDSSSGSGTPEQNQDKIIYSSEVTVETTEFDETIGKISGLVDSYGGWIESSSVSGTNYYQKARGTASTRNASYTMRIPSSRFNSLMDSLSDLGNIPYSHIYTENVTSQYIDAQARLKALTTQEARLLEMMELAETVEDVIIIEDRLTDLRYQIESIQSKLNNWDRRVSYSTVYLTVQEVREYTPEEKIDPTYGEELLAALKKGVKNAGETLKDLLVFIIEVLPVLVILVPVILLLVWLIRKLFRGSDERRAKRQARRARKQAEKQAKKNSKKNAAAAEAPAVKKTAELAVQPAPAEPTKPAEPAKPAEPEQKPEE